MKSEEYDLKLRKAVAQLHAKRDLLRKKKKTVLIKELNETLFALPNVLVSENIKKERIPSSPLSTVTAPLDNTSSACLLIPNIPQTPLSKNVLITHCSNTSPHEDYHSCYIEIFA